MKCERCGVGFSCEIKSGNDCWCKTMPPLKPLPPQYKNCLCPECLKLFTKNSVLHGPNGLVEGEDFYYQHNKFVFTEKYHLDKGYCCNSGCKHCPYGE